MEINQNFDHTKLSPFFLMKIKDVNINQEARSIQHYRQRAKIKMGREMMMVTKRNAIIVRRRDILQRIVGKRVEAWKGKDCEGEEGQIERDQTRPKKEIQI